MPNMKAFLLAFTSLFVAASAQSSSPYYNLQSNPFRLVLKSANSTLDGRLLDACHQGAAIEGLCLTNSTTSAPVVSYQTFYHNVSSSAGNTVNANDTNGVLNLILNISGGEKIPSAMQFSYNPGSNLADPNFFPGNIDYQLVGFDECDSMYVSVYLNDQVTPPTEYNPILQLKNWYICLTRYSYLYTTLTFKLGVTGEPQNPTCQPVEVVRVWI